MQVQLASFLAVSMLVIVAPGPDMALVARYALVGGRRVAVVASLGVVTGLAIWTLAASVGIAALLRESEPAFLTLKVVGAAYLVFLGVQTLRAARRRGEGAPPAASGGRPRRALRQGLLSNLANPKIAVFFTTFLPQFTSRPSFLPLCALGLVFCVITLAWLVGYGAVVARAGDVLRRPRVRRALEAVTGTVLIGFGLRLATEHR